MNRTDEGNDAERVRRWTPFTFWRWTFLFLVPYGIGNTILVALVGLALHLQPRSLLIPYLMLSCCGFVAASLIYWARQSFDRPRSGSVRFALAIFLVLNLHLGTLLFSAVKVGILSATSALNRYGPEVLLTSLLGSLVVYIMVRRQLEAISQSDTPRERMQRWTPFTFWRWTFTFLVPYGIGNTVLVALVGLALHLQPRSLLIPYVLLLWCGSVGAFVIYWARQSYERPRSGSIRFALAIFFFLNLYLFTLLFSAVTAGILTADSALLDYGPYILPASLLGSLVVYIVARRRLETISQSDAQPAP